MLESPFGRVRAPFWVTLGVSQKSDLPKRCGAFWFLFRFSQGGPQLLNEQREAGPIYASMGLPDTVRQEEGASLPVCDAIAPLPGLGWQGEEL